MLGRSWNPLMQTASHIFRVGVLGMGPKPPVKAENSNNATTSLRQKYCFTTRLFTILEPQDQEIGRFYVVKNRRSTDFEAQKLYKRVGRVH